MKYLFSEHDLIITLSLAAGRQSLYDFNIVMNYNIALIDLLDFPARKNDKSRFF